MLQISEPGDARGVQPGEPGHDTLFVAARPAIWAPRWVHPQSISGGAGGCEMQDG